MEFLDLITDEPDELLIDNEWLDSHSLVEAADLGWAIRRRIDMLGMQMDQAEVPAGIIVKWTKKEESK